MSNYRTFIFAGTISICTIAGSVQGWACSWDLNGVGYPPECGYRGGGVGGGGVPQQAPQQTLQQAQWAAALRLNNQGLAAQNAGNWDNAVVHFLNALDYARIGPTCAMPANTPCSPNDAIILDNYRKALAHVANDKGIKAANAGNWVLALSLYEQALINSPNDAVIADNIKKARTALSKKSESLYIGAAAASAPAAKVNGEWVCPPSGQPMLSKYSLNSSRFGKPDENYCVGSDAVPCGSQYKSWACPAGKTCNGDGRAPKLCR